MIEELRRLYPVSPYEGFDPARWPSDVQGWGENGVFDAIIPAIRPRLIVEVGTWKGASAIRMADIVRAHGLDTTIVCVDTWLGSPEHVLGEVLSFGDALAPRFGYPTLYYSFLANVVRAGHAERILPLPATSESAAVILGRLGVRPDLVHIDAAHEHDAALRDYRDYWRLMAGAGVLVGDDFGWREVRRAAIRFARGIGRPYGVEAGKFVVSADARVAVAGRTHGPLRYAADAGPAAPFE